MWPKAKIVERPDMENLNLLDTGALPLMFEMERAGVMIDLPRLAALNARLSTEKEQLALEIHRLAGREFNIASDQQLATILFDEMRIDSRLIRKTEKTRRPSVKREELEKIAALHPIVRKIISWNERDDLQSKFTAKMPELVQADGRLRTVFKSTRTATGRFASGDKDLGLPNLNNIPVRTKLGQEIRHCFIARPGFKIISIDFSQIEMRATAHESKDENLCGVFRDADDIHWRTAEAALHKPRPVNWKTIDKDGIQPSPDELTVDERRKLKRVSFGVLYGLTPPGLRNQMIAEGGDPDEWTVAKCGDYIGLWFSAYPKVRPMMERFLWQGRKHGYVWDIWGRVMPAVEVKSRNEKIRSKAEREICNRPIQAGATGFTKLAMRDLYLAIEEKRKQKAQVYPLLVVHDEIVLEAKDSVADDLTGEFTEVMQNVIDPDTFAVPLVASGKAAGSWGGAH